jgi:hypothetical protein
VSQALLVLPMGVLARVCGAKEKEFRCLLSLGTDDTSPRSAEWRGENVVNKGMYLNSWENLQFIKSCQKETLVGAIDCNKNCIKRNLLIKNRSIGISFCDNVRGFLAICDCRPCDE